MVKIVCRRERKKSHRETRTGSQKIRKLEKTLVHSGNIFRTFTTFGLNYFPTDFLLPPVPFPTLRKVL